MSNTCTVNNDTTPWVTAAMSGGNGGNCVEIRRRSAVIEVRDTKDRAGAVLAFTRPEWAAFLDGAKHCEFDHLLTD
jgi:hypothetical protein